MAHGRFAHRILGVFRVDAQAARQPGGYFEHLFVQERHAQLQRVGHAHAVGLEQDVPGQPDVDVQILHLGHVVLALDAVVEGARQFLRAGAGHPLPQQLALLLHGEHAAIADEAFLDRLCAADQETLAAEAERQRLGDRRKRLAQEQRQLFIARQVVRLVVDIVAAEELVRALAGEDHLDILARNLGDKI